MNWSYKLRFACFLLVISLCACSCSNLSEVETTEHPHAVFIKYIPIRDHAKIIKSGVLVNVVVSDARLIKDRISSRRLEFSDVEVPIVALNSIQDLVREAIEQELTDRGFSVSAQGCTVKVELTRFYNEWRWASLFRSDAVAQVEMNIEVIKNNQTPIFKRAVSEQETLASIVLPFGHNAKKALEAALSNAISELFNDQLFLEAVSSAGKI
jgi:uncharacterized lipoprotein YajG